MFGSLTPRFDRTMRALSLATVLVVAGVILRRASEGAGHDRPREAEGEGQDRRRYGQHRRREDRQGDRCRDVCREQLRLHQKGV